MIADGITEKYNSKTGKLEKVKPIKTTVWNHYCERCGKHIDYFTAHTSYKWDILCINCANELCDYEDDEE